MKILRKIGTFRTSPQNFTRVFKILHKVLALESRVFISPQTKKTQSSIISHVYLNLPEIVAASKTAKFITLAVKLEHPCPSTTPFPKYS